MHTSRVGQGEDGRNSIVEGCMGFQEHVERTAVDVVGEFPADDGIYAVTFRIDSVDQDPRFPYVAVGYTTEAYAAEQAGLASDSWEARWSYASFPETGLEGVREVGRDPAVADAHRREAESRGLWWPDTSTRVVGY
ncbi:hypothetical protein ACFWBV_13425 [Streptomyces sp. NPDC060030]|uniref:hypothetical protein n=1 Tax=Streptomyces sp. NPDC060030 TaxID=3347042 RepID=UPI0036881673